MNKFDILALFSNGLSYILYFLIKIFKNFMVFEVNIKLFPLLKNINFYIVLKMF